MTTKTPPEAALKQLGLELPAAPAPVGAYVPAVATGKLIYTSGQLPFVAGKLMAAGKVPTQVPLETARACARQCALNALAAVRTVAGSLDRVARIVRVNVFIHSAPGFAEQAKAADGASALLVEIFGDAGRHTRCTIGVSEMPLNAPMELDMVVELM